MKPIAEMTDTEVNCEIAERRGWTAIIITDGGAMLGLPPEPKGVRRYPVPAYFAWQWGGPLLEELLLSSRSVGLSLRDDNSVDLTAMMMGDYVNERKLQYAVPRAWLMWDRRRLEAPKRDEGSS